MLSNENLLKVLDGLVKSVVTENPVWVQSKNNTLHNYAKPACSICGTANADANIRRACARFYANNPGGLNTCPFGITVRSVDIDLGGTHATVHFQEAVDKEKMESTVSRLPRKSKKVGRQAIKTNRYFQLLSLIHI